ncbi:MAG: AN1-type zinc finger domain-containing protein [Nitrososphaerota archaeon]|nr:hypothetical protein [Candidatus Bathyarchaeota archaeon]MDW8048679.1 AN1-type zinc finger domain-containing protein [Nitrososphaerota archaeon]
MRCDFCGKEVAIPFKCPFCSGYFCPDHRLPEMHSCPEISRVRSRKLSLEKPPSRGEQGFREIEVSSLTPFKFLRPRLTSTTELVHILLGTIIVMAVGLSLFVNASKWAETLFYNLDRLVAPVSLFAFLFISHELAHKITAKYFGLWAEFRLDRIGTLLSIISILPIPIKFISPGAVVMIGAATRRIVGLVSLAGPFTTIMISYTLLIMHFYIVDHYLAVTLLNGAFLGAWLALLNILPFGMMDGAKIYHWNVKAWLSIFLASLFLFLAIVKIIL